MDVMARQNILHQVHRSFINVFAKLLSKIDLGTKEVSDWPEPLLMEENEKWNIRNILNL